MALLDLDELPELDRRLSWFGWNRWRPLAFYDRDHFRFLKNDESLDVTPRPNLCRQRVERYLNENDVSEAPARIMLLTNLRVLGYVFNPVSFYFCYDQNETLTAVLAEVNNTYLEQKMFLIEADKGAAEQPVAERRTLKNFYVSPFIAHNTDFYFRLRAPGDLVNIRIDSLRAHHRILKAILHGKKRALTNGSLVRMFFRYPLVSAKIIAAIHYQALRLFARRIYVHDKIETDKKIDRLEKMREAIRA